jgi:hypothetical protein
MKRITAIALVIFTPLGGIVLLVIGAVIEAAHAYSRSKGCVTGAKVSKDAKERFYGQLQEHEFRVINVGPTVFPKGARQ